MRQTDTMPSRSGASNGDEPSLTWELEVQAAVQHNGGGECKGLITLLTSNILRHNSSSYAGSRV
jgi:hypothetical protein